MDEGGALRGQLCGKRFRLLQNVLHRGLLEVGRIAVAAENALHVAADIGAGRIPIHPVDGDIGVVKQIILCDGLSPPI